jgi:ABC-type glycerol-3-phosphate transport system permease component
MPNVKPAWLTLLIFTFQSLWNGAGSRFIYTESLKVLPTILNQISSAGIARAGVGSAVAVVLMIPPIITFLLVESNVLETMAHSGIKD